MENIYYGKEKSNASLRCNKMAKDENELEEGSSVLKKDGEECK
jgi:hypothetical protein